MEPSVTGEVVRWLLIIIGWFVVGAFTATLVGRYLKWRLRWWR